MREWRAEVHVFPSFQYTIAKCFDAALSSLFRAPNNADPSQG